MRWHMRIRPDRRGAHATAAGGCNRAGLFLMGTLALGGGGWSPCYGEAFRWFRKAAEDGETGAQYNLGLLYAGGLGVEQNDAEAARWYRQSAERGCERAQFNLALACEQGRGVPQDFPEAARWYEQAAGRGDAGAMGNLGAMYLSGRGVPRDVGEAFVWLTSASGLGVRGTEAACRIALALLNSNGGEAVTVEPITDRRTAFCQFSRCDRLACQRGCADLVPIPIESSCEKYP